MNLNITPETEECLKQLAAEDGKTMEEMVAELVLETDRKRHVIAPPFEPERRIHCCRNNCAETGRGIEFLEMFEV